MPEFTVEGVVLRRWDSGESDRRIALLTKERGKMYATARGARKANARLAGVSEPGVHAKFGLATGKQNAYITQVQPLTSNSGLRSDFVRLSAGLAFLETLDALLQSDEIAADAFDLCLVALDSIARVREPLGALCWADLKLLAVAGFTPEFSVSVVSGKPLVGPEVLLSAEAGGALNVSEGHSLRRHQAVSREYAVALSKIQDLPASPDFVKHALATCRCLFPFFLEITGSDLPARRSLFETILST